MKHFAMNAEMGLDGYATIHPAQWALEIPRRLDASSRWHTLGVQIGIEDDEDGERVSLTNGATVDPAFAARIESSDSCSLFLTVGDKRATWTLPFLFTRSDDQGAVVTASIYESELEGGGDVWARLTSLRDLCADIVFVASVEWIRFGIEGDDAISPDSTVFVLISSVAWARNSPDQQSLLSEIAEGAARTRTAWLMSPPSLGMPKPTEGHLEAIRNAMG